MKFDLNTIAHRVGGVGTMLTAASVTGAISTLQNELPADTPTWVTHDLHYLCIALVLLGALASGIAKLLIAAPTAKDVDDATRKAQGLPPVPTLLAAVALGLGALCLGGCSTTVAVAKQNKDTITAVQGVSDDVTFIANLIANNWAEHETDKANRLYNDAIRADSVTATVQPTLPDPSNPNPPKTVQVVPEPTRTILLGKLNNDLAAIAVGRKNIYQSVVNRFSGNLTAAQNLLQGQQQYYATAGANNSTLATGTQTVLDLFQQFAPVIAAQLSAPAPTVAVKATVK